MSGAPAAPGHPLFTCSKRRAAPGGPAVTFAASIWLLKRQVYGSNMGDFTSQIEGCSVFSKLDLKNGYLQENVLEDAFYLGPLGSSPHCQRQLRRVGAPRLVQLLFFSSVQPRTCVVLSRQPHQFGSHRCQANQLQRD